MTTVQAHVIIGTAGHIDHGKTSLTKVLTGVDTDRLPEEKERGITIELGFAPLDLPSGMRVGVVDVPGHERFVRTMVAGAAGIDLVVLVIAADEGVMPQTREHLDICQLLGVRGGLVALTKVDLVEPDWLELVIAETERSLEGTFLERAPIIPFSSITGQGKEKLLAALDALVKTVPPRSSEGIFRLPVDRVFTIKGFGTVVTGTVISGKVRVGDEVRFFPGEVAGKVRGIQVHESTVAESAAGQRTALNIQGLDKESMERGQTAAHADSLLATHLLDVKAHLLSSAPRPLADRTRIRVDLFTSEVLARAIVLSAPELKAGGEEFVQLRLESPVVALPGDRLILRSWSPAATIGGATVLDPFPSKHRKGRGDVVENLERLGAEDPGARVEALLDGAGALGAPLGPLAVRAGIVPARAERILGGMVKAGKAVVVGTGESSLAWSASAYGALRNRVLSILADFHKANPLRTGMSREELRSRLSPDFPDKAFRVLIDDLAGQKTIEAFKDEVRAGAHEATLSPEQSAIRKKVLDLVGKSGLTPPFLDEMAGTLAVQGPQLKAVLSLLAQQGELVRIKDDYYLDPAAHSGMLSKVEALFAAKSEMAMPDFRDLTGATRKWMIPLLEYLDRTGITLRKGDVRIRRGKVSP